MEWLEKKKRGQRRFLHPLKPVVSCAAISMNREQRRSPAFRHRFFDPPEEGFVCPARQVGSRRKPGMLLIPFLQGYANIYKHRSVGVFGAFGAFEA